MATYSVTLTFDNLESVVDELERRTLETISQGVEHAAEAIKWQWIDRLSHARGIWSVEKQAVIASIKWRWTDNAHLSAVVETTLPLADEIENGRPAKDLKRMLGTSPKVHQGKNGRYLIIPFRHNTPGNIAHAPAMPPDVLKKAKYLSASTVTGTGNRVSGTGAYDVKTRKLLTVPQNRYAWGASLPAGMAPKLKPHHTTEWPCGFFFFLYGAAFRVRHPAQVGIALRSASAARVCQPLPLARQCASTSASSRSVTACL